MYALPVLDQDEREHHLARGMSPRRMGASVVRDQMSAGGGGGEASRRRVGQGGAHFSGNRNRHPRLEPTSYQTRTHRVPNLVLAYLPSDKLYNDAISVYVSLPLI